MNKLWLIFKREYSVRVRKRTFIITTILMPLAFAALAIGSGLITAMGANSKKVVLVKDDSHIFERSETNAFYPRIGKSVLSKFYRQVDYDGALRCVSCTYECLGTRLT